MSSRSVARRPAQETFSLSSGSSLRGPGYDKALERFENALYKVYELFKSFDQRQTANWATWRERENHL